VTRMPTRSEGREAEALSLQRMKTTRSSGKSSKRSGFSASVLRVLGFFLDMAGLRLALAASHHIPSEGSICTYLRCVSVKGNVARQNGFGFIC
jgi:hypothetical protein